LTVDDELRDRAFAGVGNDFASGARRRLDINFSEGNVEILKDAARFAAVPAPGCGINDEFHGPHAIQRVKQVEVMAVTR
jgi:hypothetical protein